MEGFRFPPEVEEILQDIARDPNSTLLRVRRPEIRTGYLESLEPIRPSQTGLSVAERELLLTHREEVVYLLQHWVHARFQEVLPGGLPFERAGCLSRDKWKGRSQRAVGIGAHQDELASGLEALQQCLEGEANVEQVIDINLRILERPVTLQQKALLLRHAGDFDAAVHCAEHAIRKTHNRSLQGYCWNIIGAAQCCQREFRASANSNEKAVVLGEPRLIVAAAWMSAALQAGDLGQVAHAAEALDIAGDPDSDELKRICDEQRLSRELGLWSASDQARKKLNVAKELVGAAGRNVLDAFN